MDKETFDALVEPYRNPLFWRKNENEKWERVHTTPPIPYDDGNEEVTCEGPGSFHFMHRPLHNSFDSMDDYVLIGKGYDIRLYDRNVNIASLTGANREYILNSIPHISKLMMATMDGVLEHGDTIGLGGLEGERCCTLIFLDSKDFGPQLSVTEHTSVDEADLLDSD